MKAIKEIRAFREGTHDYSVDIFFVDGTQAVVSASFDVCLYDVKQEIAEEDEVIDLNDSYYIGKIESAILDKIDRDYNGGN